MLVSQRGLNRRIKGSSHLFQAAAQPRTVPQNEIGRGTAPPAPLAVMVAFWAVLAPGGHCPRAETGSSRVSHGVRARSPDSVNSAGRSHVSKNRNDKGSLVPADGRASSDHLENVHPRSKQHSSQPRKDRRAGAESLLPEPDIPPRPPRTASMSGQDTQRFRPVNGKSMRSPAAVLKPLQANE
jgi:hypothetical protein